MVRMCSIFMAPTRLRQAGCNVIAFAKKRTYKRQALCFPSKRRLHEHSFMRPCGYTERLAAVRHRRPSRTVDRACLCESPSGGRRLASAVVYELHVGSLTPEAG